MELTEKLISQLDSQYFPPRGAKLIVGVSGGVDSVVLLHILVLLANQWDWDILVAHFNHQLRKSADQDAKLVKNLAKNWGLKFIQESKDVNSLSKTKKLTLEEAGRMARYDWLQKMAYRYRGIIVIAHTADDQVETIVMNWLRGGLVRALTGMKIKKANIWRPFLSITKIEINKFAQHYHLLFCEDVSNQDIIYTRNLIRHKILPVLEKVNPGVREVILRTSASFSELNDWIEGVTKDSFKKTVLSQRKDIINFNEKKFMQLSIFLQNELLLLAVQQLKGDRQDFSKVHLQEIHKVISSPQKISWKQLPGKLFIGKGYGKISVSHYRPKFVNQ